MCGDRLRGHFFKSKLVIECGIVIHVNKFMSLCIMQLLSVLFECNIYYLFI